MKKKICLNSGGTKMRNIMNIFTCGRNKYGVNNIILKFFSKSCAPLAFMYFIFLLQNYFVLHQIKDLDLRMLEFSFFFKSEQY
jgi:hypothetical protein